MTHFNWHLSNGFYAFNDAGTYLIEPPKYSGAQFKVIPPANGEDWSIPVYFDTFAAAKQYAEKSYVINRNAPAIS